MKKTALLLSVVFGLLVLAPVAQAQYIYRDEVAAAQGPVYDMLRSNKNRNRIAGMRSRVDNLIYDGIDYATYVALAKAQANMGGAGVNNSGCFGQPQPVDRPMGKIWSAALGGTLGASGGYAIFGNGRGAAGLGAVGAVTGLLFGNRGEKQYRQRQAAEAETIRAHESQMAQTRAQAEVRAQAQAEVQARAEAESLLEDKILRNRFKNVTVRYYIKTDNHIQSGQLAPGQTIVLQLPPNAYVWGEADLTSESGQVYTVALGFGRGKRYLPENSGWEFFSPAMEKKLQAELAKGGY